MSKLLHSWHYFLRVCQYQYEHDITECALHKYPCIVSRCHPRSANKRAKRLLFLLPLVRGRRRRTSTYLFFRMRVQNKLFVPDTHVSLVSIRRFIVPWRNHHGHCMSSRNHVGHVERERNAPGSPCKTWNPPGSARHSHRGMCGYNNLKIMDTEETNTAIIRYPNTTLSFFETGTRVLTRSWWKPFNFQNKSTQKSKQLRY